MRYFSYVLPDDNEIDITKVIYSEREILEEFWKTWSTEMKGNGYSELISIDNCIDDWCTMNWAKPEDIYRFKEGYDGKHFVINEFHLQDPEFNHATVICVNDSIQINRYINIPKELIKI